MLIEISVRLKAVERSKFNFRLFRMPLDDLQTFLDCFRMLFNAPDCFQMLELEFEHDRRRSQRRRTRWIRGARAHHQVSTHELLALCVFLNFGVQTLATASERWQTEPEVK